MIAKRCLVLLSGGQDSTTCLFWAKQNFSEVSTISFDYGQRHSSKEIEAQIKVSELAEVADENYHSLSLGTAFRQVGGSSLTGEGLVGDVDPLNNLPKSFVPGRNLIFLTYAASLAYTLGIHDLVGGMCQTDYSGYPDCREETLESLGVAIRQGLDYKIVIHTPLMYLTKADTVRLAQNLPGCMEALTYSHTCYEGIFPPCGVCPACKLRAKGFQEAGVQDPLLLRRSLERR